MKQNKDNHKFRAIILARLMGGTLCGCHFYQGGKLINCYYWSLSIFLYVVSKKMKKGEAPKILPKWYTFFQWAKNYYKPNELTCFRSILLASIRRWNRKISCVQIWTFIVWWHPRVHASWQLRWLTCRQRVMLCSQEWLFTFKLWWGFKHVYWYDKLLAAAHFPCC